MNDEIKDDFFEDECNCPPEEGTIKKIIRPGTLVLTLIFFLTIMVIDGNFFGFTVREAYLPILETVLVTMVIAYFSSRGIEKTARDIYTKNSRTPNFDNPYTKYRRRRSIKKDPNYPGYEDEE